MAAEVVVASGADCAKVIIVDVQNNSDLLWALRGAGNGNFGIVTSLTYKASPRRASLSSPRRGTGLGDLPAVFDAWQRMAPFADDRLGTQLEIHTGEFQLVAVLAAGSEARAKPLLAPILSVGNPMCR